MSTYTIHLGFNTNSPLIGSIWDTGNGNQNYYFLQYAVAHGEPSNPGGAAQFKFKTGDAIYVVVWDLSSSPVPMDCILDMALSSLDAPPQTYDPSSYMSLGNVASATDTSPYYLQFSLFVPKNTSESSPWGPCSSWYTSTGSISFTAKINCKLSFRLSAEPSGGGGSKRVYITDPEVIVGSGS